MRKLATIRRVDEVFPIEGADSIEGVRVGGWAVVVLKSEAYKAGDKIIFCEIDSVFPEKPEFEFLRDRKFRIKSIKLRGQISQGICFPLSILPKGKWNEDDDVTDALGIVLYEPKVSASLGGDAKGLFPGCVPKTDEERIQNLGREIEGLIDERFYITEKLDGTSVTFMLHKDMFDVCSRNLAWKRMDLPEKISWIRSIWNKVTGYKPRKKENNVYWKVALWNDIEEKMRAYREKNGFDFAIQGEIVGEGIQGNKYKIAGQKLFVFNVFNISTQKFLSLDEMKSVVAELGLEFVPVIETDFVISARPEFKDACADLIKATQERKAVIDRAEIDKDLIARFNQSRGSIIGNLLSMADGNSVIYPAGRREGLVFRNQNDVDCSFSKKSFKAISNQFLLKEKDE